MVYDIQSCDTVVRLEPHQIFVLGFDRERHRSTDFTFSSFGTQICNSFDYWSHEYVIYGDTKLFRLLFQLTDFEFFWNIDLVLLRYKIVWSLITKNFLWECCFTFSWYMDMSKLFYIFLALCQTKSSWSLTKISDYVEASFLSSLRCWFSESINL